MVTSRNLALLFLALVIIALACNDSSYSGIDKQLQEKIVVDPGFVLLEKKCTTCHSLNSEESNPLGPDVYEFVSEYKNRYNTLKSFKREISEFVVKPTKSMAVMKSAVEKYGLMSAVQLSKDEQNAISEFLYKYDLGDPDWYSTHFANRIKDKKNKDKKLAEYKSYAMAAQKALGSELKKAMQEGGPTHAVTYCNLSAIPLTDSMSQLQDVHIKRVTDRPRNQSNQASKQELEIMNNFQQLLSNNEPVEGELSEDKLTAYFPILTNQLCLNCHGSMDQITPDTYEKIKKLYPKDKAVGYGNAELRGMWVIKK